MKNKSNYLKIAVNLLKKAASEFSNHGCNDYYIEDTVDNRNMFIEMMQKSDDEFKVEDIEIFVRKDNKLLVQDWMLMYFLAEKLSVWRATRRNKKTRRNINL